VSPKHANVIVNTGGSTAEDVIRLMRTMRDRACESSGVRLEPEIVLLGDLGERFRA
jgi:UDP-N-acetylmuramate dehydrogenase